MRDTRAVHASRLPPVAWSSDPLLPAAPEPAGVDGAITGMFPWVPFCNAVFWVTFFRVCVFQALMLDGSCCKEFVLVPAKVWALAVVCPFRKTLM